MSKNYFPRKKKERLPMAPSVLKQSPIQVLDRKLLNFSDRASTGVFNAVWSLLCHCLTAAFEFVYVLEIIKLFLK